MLVTPDDVAVDQARGELLSLSFISRDLAQGGFSFHSLVHQHARATLDSKHQELQFSRRAVETVAATLILDDNRNADQWVYERSILPHISRCESMITKSLAPGNDLLDDETRMLLCRFARSLQYLGDIPGSIRLCRRALASVEPSQFTYSDLSIVEVMNTFGVNLRIQGHFSEATEWHEKAKGVIGKSHITSKPHHLASLQTDQNMAAVQLELGDFDRVVTELARILERQKELVGEKDPVVLDTRHKLGLALVNKGGKENLEKAMAEFELVHSLRLERLKHDHPSTLEAASAMAMCLLERGLYGKALEQYQRILEQQKKSAGPTHHSTLDTMESIAAAMERQGRFSGALERYRDVHEKMITAFGTSTHPWALIARTGVANNLLRLARYAEAREIYDEVFHGYKSLGMMTSGAWGVRSDIARIHRDLGQYDEALSACEDVLLGLQGLDQTHESVLVAKQCKATILERQGKFSEASALYGELLKIDEYTLGESHPEFLRTKYFTGGLAARRGQYSEALVLLKQVEEGFQVPDHNHPVALLAIRERAGILGELGQYDGLLGLYQRVRSAKEKEKGGSDSEGRYDSEYYYAVFGQARLHIMQGRYTEGRKLLEEAANGWKSIFTSSDHPLVLMCLEELSTTYIGTGDLKEAQRLCEESVQGCQTKLGPDHPQTHRAQASLSAILAKSSARRSEAAELCSASLERLRLGLGPTHLWTLQAMRIQGRIMARRHRYWKALTLTLKAAHGRRRLSSSINQVSV